MSEVKDLENKTLSQAEPVLPDTAEKAVTSSHWVKGKWENMTRLEYRRYWCELTLTVVNIPWLQGSSANIRFLY